MKGTAMKISVVLFALLVAGCGGGDGGPVMIFDSTWVKGDTTYARNIVLTEDGKRIMYERKKWEIK